MSPKSGAETREPATHLPLTPVLSFLRTIWSTAHELQSTSKFMARALGVTGPQRFALQVLSQHDGLSAGQLAHVLHLDPSTLTGILRRLEARKLVRRVVDPTDARRVFLHLTDSGRGYTRVRNGTVESAVRRVLGEVSDRDAQGARVVLEALSRALGDLRGGDELPARNEAHGSAPRRPRTRAGKSPAGTVAT